MPQGASEASLSYKYIIIPNKEDYVYGFYSLFSKLG